MKIFKFLKNLWIFSASWFTAIATLFCLFIIIMSANSPNSSSLLLDPVGMLRILLLSLLMGMGSAFCRLDGIDKNLGICLHAGFYNVGFFIFLWLSLDYKNGDNSRLSTAVIGTIILAIVYAAVMVGIKMIPKAIKSGKKKSVLKKANAKSSAAEEPSNNQKKSGKAKKEEKTPYKNQFS